MRGEQRRRRWSRAGFIVLLLHVSLVLGASAARSRRRLAEATEVVLSVPRGRSPYVSTAPTKLVQADFGRPLNGDIQPLQLFQTTGAARREDARTPLPAWLQLQPSFAQSDRAPSVP